MLLVAADATAASALEFAAVFVLAASVEEPHVFPDAVSARVASAEEPHALPDAVRLAAVLALALVASRAAPVVAAASAAW